MGKKKKTNSVDKTIEECQAMIDYAMASGKQVSPNVLATLKKLKLYKDYQEHLETNESTGSRSTHRQPHPFETYSKQKRISMNENEVVSRSDEVEEVVVPSEEEMVNELSMVHADLSSTVYPAAPSTIVLLEEQKKKPLRFLGPVPLVQRMNIMAIICILTAVGMFLTHEVDAYTVNSNILNIDDTWGFIFNELVILSLAAAGASFYALFEAYKYISNASYDPKYESIYWVRFILGIMSGVILAQFIFIDPEVYGGGSAETQDSPQSLAGFLTYKPLLAFLGGFSARVVHKILNSLVDSLETFISGSARDMVRAREEAAKVQTEEKLNTIRRENEIEKTNFKFNEALRLIKLKEELGDTENVALLKAKLNELIQEQLEVVQGTTVNPTPPNPVVNEPVVNPEDVVFPGDINMTDGVVNDPPVDPPLDPPVDPPADNIPPLDNGGEGLDINLDDDGGDDGRGDDDDFKP